MHKEKKLSMSQEKAEKSKPKSTRVCSWSEENFKELYPEEPAIQTSSTFFTVGLNYRGSLIKVKVPTGINNSCLPYIFHKEIFKFLLNTKDSNPLLKTAQVVGFETVDFNLLLDYQISIGKGILTEKTTFNCLEFVPEGRLKKYKICKCLAIGGFSKVYLVRNLRDGNFYAMKVMAKRFISDTQKESIIENEKNISAQLNHPFIVRLNHAFETTNFVCLVLDYCPGGELFFYLKQVKRMTEEDAKFYFIEILYGLLYLHQQKIIYRDLKPENLLINYDGHIKIADFGLSKQNMKERELTYSFCGSTEYMPPEMILREGHSFGVDFYTLGALLYELVTGLPPFYSKDEEEIREAIVNEDLTFPDHIPLSNEIKNLLSGLLHKNPKMRIGSMRGLKEILFHPWVGKINAESILSKEMEPPYIPPVDEFNFDENELGDDEAEFTEALLQENLISAAREKLEYENFEFLNERPLKTEIQSIYDKYGKSSVQNSNNSTANRIRDDSKELKKSHSLKFLKKTNTSSDGFKQVLKRQSSTPYLRSASANGHSSSKPKKLSQSGSQSKLFKNLSNTKTKESLLRSNSGSKSKYSLDRAIASFNPISPLSSYSKPVKKKSCRGNSNSKLHKENSISQIMQKGKDPKEYKRNELVQCSSANAFLKKKKLMQHFNHI